MKRKAVKLPTNKLGKRVYRASNGLTYGDAGLPSILFQRMVARVVKAPAAQKSGGKP